MVCTWLCTLRLSVSFIHILSGHNTQPADFGGTVNDVVYPQPHIHHADFDVCALNIAPRLVVSNVTCVAFERPSSRPHPSS